MMKNTISLNLYKGKPAKGAVTAVALLFPLMLSTAGCSDEKATEKLSEVTETVKEEAKSATDSAVESADKAIEETKESVAAVIDSGEQKVEEAVASVKETVTAPVTPAEQAVSSPEENDETAVSSGSDLKIDRFKVCADPYSLPGSNQDQEGYENKIAKLFADKLAVPLEFEWFPQRIGFIRNTLRNDDTEDGRHKCDIVMGVTQGFELAATTKPYFRSAWSMVYVKGRGLDYIDTQDDLKNLSDDKKKALRIGIFDRSPATEWIFHNDLMDQAYPYQIMTGDARAYPGQIIENDLANDEINLTFVWGPIAGYFARQVEKEKGVEVKVIPMMNEMDIQFDYKITMAVRYGENEWKEKINSLIDENQEEINAILEEYGVPLLEL